MRAKLPVLPTTSRHLVRRLIAPGILLTLALLGSSHAAAEWFSDQQAIMGTSVSVTLWHDEPRIAREAIAAVMAEMHRIDATYSPYKADSALARVNREASSRPVNISREMATIIDKALYFSRASDGAFDISFASVGRHYDYRDQQQPAESERNTLLPAVDYRLIDLDQRPAQGQNQAQNPDQNQAQNPAQNPDQNQATIYFKHPQMQIDLGGIAKGFAVDRGIELLEGFNITHATVSAGGDSRVLGDKRGEPWIVGIKNPRGQAVDREVTEREADEVAIKLPLVDTAVSTSGDYERFFIDQKSGERVHHIMNPRTGKSATGIASVSVLGPRSFDTDPLSTTVFVLGITAGLELVNSMPGFDAIIIDSAGQVHYSAGLIPAE